MAMKVRTAIAGTMTGLLILGPALFPAMAEEARAVPVVVRQIQYEAYAPSLEMTGSVQPANSTDLGFRGAGRIGERFADVGDRVAAGEPLARLDAIQQEAALAAAEAAVRAEQAQRDQAEADHARLAALLESGSTTRSAVDRAYATLQVASGIVEATEAELALARDALANTTLSSPVDGLITARHAEAGEVVQPAQPVFTVAEDGIRDAVFDVYEAGLLTLDEDTGIELRVMFNGEHGFAGHVREISPSIDLRTGTILVKVAIDAPPEVMPLGATVVGRASLRPRQAIVLPPTALTLGKDGASVWVVTQPEGRLELRPVTVLSFESDKVVLSGGVEDGETVVTSGPRAMRPGLPVDPTEEAAR
ncbi:efflux RND transporter periplasmic adaptor subunit [Aliihoeflea sp. 40Bstr573]|uniref:efflux RND transporter periplasmic adaptor subunit n=1 Tax=Aliihoeflea sp. 40Bstr573 TaxID=2696467 RepID=UPI0020947520|nr:efflux RND transporter periplasmic adaptor subunit [Aliihoeflea sp. 40Bstr573]MCO6389338.1 efflux RND transporter periplasmic adaptor subunit [Aliihoeflea sp. 40Bstr573]